MTTTTLPCSFAAYTPATADFRGACDAELIAHEGAPFTASELKYLDIAQARGWTPERFVDVVERVRKVARSEEPAIVTRARDVLGLGSEWTYRPDSIR